MTPDGLNPGNTTSPVSDFIVLSLPLDVGKLVLNNGIATGLLGANEGMGGPSTRLILAGVLAKTGVNIGECSVLRVNIGEWSVRPSAGLDGILGPGPCCGFSRTC